MWKLASQKWWLIVCENVKENYNNGWWKKEDKIKQKVWLWKIELFLCVILWMINCEEIAFAVHPRG